MKLRPVPHYFGPKARLNEPPALAAVTPGQALHHQVQPPPMIRLAPDHCVTAPGGPPSPDKNEVDGQVDTGFSGPSSG
jgi:hypothetical protein